MMFKTSLRQPRHVVFLSIIVCLGSAAYSGSLGGRFVYDDIPSIVENPFVHEPALFLTQSSRSNRIVGYLTFALNYRVGGLDPFGYHVMNVGIHVLTAMLVYVLVVLVFRTKRLARSGLTPLAPAVAFVSAALFVAHPIQTQAVAYIVQRLTSLATLFYLGGVVGYVYWRLCREGSVRSRGGNLLPYVLALTSTVLAMRTKEIAFTLPIALLLAEIIFFDAKGRGRILPLVPFGATMAIIPLTVLRTQRARSQIFADLGPATSVQTDMSRWDYVLTQISVVADYLRLIAYPVGQNVDPDHPIYQSLLAPHVLLAGAALGALVTVALVLVYGGRVGRADPAALVVSFGLVWFFLGLSVESSVIPIVDVMNEHRVYLPLAGLLMATVTAGGWFAQRMVPLQAATVVLVAGATLACVFGAATYWRTAVWASELTLWADAAAKSPRKARPLTNLGAALHDAGRLQEARRVLEHAVVVVPGHADAWYNLGRVYLDMPEHRAGAVTMFERAIALQPEHTGAYANLAAALLELGRFHDVAALLERGPDVIRRSPEAQFNLGVAYVMIRNRAGVERQLQVLGRLSPRLAQELERFRQAQ